MGSIEKDNGDVRARAIAWGYEQWGDGGGAFEEGVNAYLADKTTTRQALKKQRDAERKADEARAYLRGVVAAARYGGNGLESLGKEMGVSPSTVREVYGRPNRRKKPHAETR